MLHFYLVELM